MTASPQRERRRPQATVCSKDELSRTSKTIMSSVPRKSFHPHADSISEGSSMKGRRRDVRVSSAVNSRTQGRRQVTTVKKLNRPQERKRPQKSLQLDTCSVKEATSFVQHTSFVTSNELHPRRGHYSEPHRDEDEQFHMLPTNLDEHPSPPHSIDYYNKGNTPLSSKTQNQLASMSASSQGLFAASPPDICQTCKVNIAEIERTTLRTFPVACPICYKPRCLLPMIFHQDQVPTKVRSFTPNLDPAKYQPVSTYSSTLLRQRPSDVITPSPDPAAIQVLRGNSSPARTDQDVSTLPICSWAKTGDFYRPAYSVPRRTLTNQDQGGITGRWTHDRFEPNFENVLMPRQEHSVERTNMDGGQEISKMRKDGHDEGRLSKKNSFHKEREMRQGDEPVEAPEQIEAEKEFFIKIEKDP